MTKQKSTKRALLLSALSLLMCVSMLIGSTFAWFTDSAASGSNVITAGNLDIVVEYTLDGTNWNNLDGATDLFQKGLWEPGHTEVVALRITNNGSLALKYNANMNIVSEKPGTNKAGNEFKLSEILTVSTGIYEKTDAVNPFFGWNESEKTLELAFADESSVVLQNTATFAQGSVLGSDKQLMPEETHYLIVRVDMAETVGNEANHKGPDFEPSINFGINVLATQFTYEKDSFGDQYDKDSEYGNSYIAAPQTATKVTNFAELKAALATGGDIAIMNDIAVEETLTVAASTVIYGQGNKLTFAGEDSITMFDATAGNRDKIAPLTIKNLVIDGQNKDYASDSRAIVVNTRSALIIEGSEIKNFHGTQIIRFAANAASDVVIKDTKIHNNHLIGDTTSDRAGAAALLYLDHCGTLLENVTIENNVIEKGSNTWNHNFAAIMYGKNSGHTLTAKNISVKNNTCGSVYVSTGLARTTVITFESGVIDNMGTFTLFQHMTVGKDMTISVDKINISNIAVGVPAILTNNGVINADIAEGGMNRGNPIYTGTGTHNGTLTNLDVQ